jgi:hypothetical protein
LCFGLELTGVRKPFFLWGILLLLLGLSTYFLATLLAIARLPFVAWHKELMVHPIELLLWYSGIPSTFGGLLIALDLFILFPLKRRTSRCPEKQDLPFNSFTVVLTAYNDEESISEAVKDFQSHPLVRRVIVVSNNLRTALRSPPAGATRGQRNRRDMTMRFPLLRRGASIRRHHTRCPV